MPSLSLIFRSIVVWSSQRVFESGDWMSIIAKLLYSVLLLSLSGVLLRELWTVWFDRTIYIGQFQVVSETGKGRFGQREFPQEDRSRSSYHGTAVQ